MFPSGDSPAAEAIHENLQPQEELLWSGSPDPQKLLNGKDIFLIPFSLLWGGFSFYWLYSVISAGAPVAFVLFGVPFALLGVFFIAGRFWVKRRTNRTTRYAITSRRAIIARDSGAMRDFPLQNQSVSNSVNGKGTHATVTFGNNAGGVFTMWENTGMDALFRMGNSFTFHDVPQPQPMLRALDRARA